MSAAAQVVSTPATEQQPPFERNEVAKTVSYLSVVPAAAPVVEQDGEVIKHSTIRYMVFAQVFRSDLNVRTRMTEAGKAELKALIAANGILQNLIGFLEMKDGMPTGRVAIVAGGRRLLCLGEVIAEGLLPEDYAFPVMIVSEEEAIAVSLAENSGREDMHPADVVAAMLALFTRGVGVEDIALSYGLEVAFVRKALKLANISPRLFEMYRTDELSYEQAAALALTDDHEKQEQVLESLGRHAQPHRIRAMLTEEHVSVTDRVAAYVTVDAYEKAGGSVLRDLFSANANTGYIINTPLLHKLAQAKLDKKAVKVAKEGHAWVEARVQFTDADKSEFAAVRNVHRVMTEAEASEMETLTAKVAELETKMETADEESEEWEALDKEVETLEKRQTAIRRSLYGPIESDKALAGAVVTVDYNGQAVVITGLIRNEDKSKMEKVEKDSESGTAKEKTDHTDRLTRVLTSHRTIALQAELMQRPDVAIVLATHAMVRSILLDGMDRHRSSGLCKISLSTASMEDDIKGSKAYEAVSAKRAELEALLPEDVSGESLFAWMMQQEQAVIWNLLAFCTAMACDFTLQRETTKSAAFVQLASTVNLDMKNWWTPTAETYFGHVSKSRMMTVVQQAVSIERSVPLEKMKKAEAAEAATLAVAATGWLPEMLRVE